MCPAAGCTTMPAGLLTTTRSRVLDRGCRAAALRAAASPRPASGTIDGDAIAGHARQGWLSRVVAADRRRGRRRSAAGSVTGSGRQHGDEETIEARAVAVRGNRERRCASRSASLRHAPPLRRAASARGARPRREQPDQHRRSPAARGSSEMNCEVENTPNITPRGSPR